MEGGKGIIISCAKKWMYVIFVEAPFAGKISFYLGREQLLAAQLQCWLCDNFESECRKNFPLIFPGWAGKKTSPPDADNFPNFPLETFQKGDISRQDREGFLNNTCILYSWNVFQIWFHV